MARRLLAPLAAHTGRAELAAAGSRAVRAVFNFGSSVSRSSLSSSERDISSHRSSSTGKSASDAARDYGARPPPLGAVAAPAVASAVALPDFAAFEAARYGRLCAALTARAAAIVAALTAGAGGPSDWSEGHVWSSDGRDADTRAWLVRRHVHIESSSAFYHSPPNNKGATVRTSKETVITNVHRPYFKL
jgi:hypothetical protein